MDFDLLSSKQASYASCTNRKKDNGFNFFFILIKLDSVLWKIFLFMAWISSRFSPSVVSPSCFPKLFNLRFPMAETVAVDVASNNMG